MADAMEQEMSEMFDEMIDAIPDDEESEAAEEKTEEVEEPEVAEEQADEPEPEPEPVEELSEGVEEKEEPQQDESPVDEQDDTGSDAGVGDVAELPVDESAALREQNEALLKRVEELSGQVIGGVMHPQTQEAKPKETSPAQPPQPQPQAQEPTPAGPTDYLGDVSIDDLLEDPTKFNAVLNNVAQSSQVAAQQQAVQQVLRSVPELVMGYITRHSAMNRMVDDFYQENSDLSNVKQTVAAVANDVHAKNPNLSVEEVFKQSAEQTRQLLGMKKAAQATVRTERKKPAFAKAGGARKPAPKVSAIQSELDDLLNGDF